MDPQYEQRLREEVIYLHSLWRQGPPKSAAATTHRGHPTTTKPQFKKKKPKIPKIPPSPTKEWPCTTTPPSPPTTTWPRPPSPHRPTVPTHEEITKLTSKTLHQNSFNLVRQFLISGNCSTSDDDSGGDYDEEEDNDEDEDEDDELMLDDDGREEYSFFFKVFKEDDELREYYEKRYADGDFNCLVCGALGGKGSVKKFKGCLPLVQHSITIAKTKRKKAHRAFGQAVCKVLGWDVDRLPIVSSMLQEKISGGETSVGDDGEKQKEMHKIENVGSVEAKDGELVTESGPIDADVSCNDDQVNEVNTDGGVENEGGKVLVNTGGMLQSSNVEVAASGDQIHDASISNNIPSSSMHCPGRENLKELSIVEQATVAEGSTSISLTCPDNDKKLEELDAAFEYKAEPPAAEPLTIKFSIHRPIADKSSEDQRTVSMHNLDETTEQEKTSVCDNENNKAVENETQDSETGNKTDVEENHQVKNQDLGNE